MVYGRYNELVFMGFINPLTSLGGTILVAPKVTSRASQALAAVAAVGLGSGPGDLRGTHRGDGGM